MKTIKFLAALVLTLGVASVSAQEKTKGEVQPVKKEVKTVESVNKNSETVQPTKKETAQPTRNETVQPTKTEPKTSTKTEPANTTPDARRIEKVQSQPVKRAEERAVEPREKVEAPKN